MLDDAVVTISEVTNHFMDHSPKNKNFLDDLFKVSLFQNFKFQLSKIFIYLCMSQRQNLSGSFDPKMFLKLFQWIF